MPRRFFKSFRYVGLNVPELPRSRTYVPKFIRQAKRAIVIKEKNARQARLGDCMYVP